MATNGNGQVELDSTQVHESYLACACILLILINVHALASIECTIAVIFVSASALSTSYPSHNIVSKPARYTSGIAVSRNGLSSLQLDSLVYPIATICESS